MYPLPGCKVFIDYKERSFWSRNLKCFERVGWHIQSAYFSGNNLVRTFCDLMGASLLKHNGIVMLFHVRSLFVVLVAVLVTFSPGCKKGRLK